jgi:hypothetical protein
MTIPVPNDPIEGWQKQMKVLFQRTASVVRALLNKVLVHRQVLMFFFNVGFALYKLIKFIASIF